MPRTRTFLPSGKSLQFVFPANRSRNQRARDHRAESFHGENAIDRQPRQSRLNRVDRQLTGNSDQLVLEFIQAAPISERCTGPSGRFPETSRAEILRLRAAPLPESPRRRVSDFVSTVIPCRIPSSRQISKCSRVCGLMPSSAAITSSTRSMPPTPASMLRTKRSCPGTSTNPNRTLRHRGRQFSVGEPEIDGDSSPLLFLQAIGVDPGKRLDQRGFPVIDVPGSPDDDGLHRTSVYSATQHGDSRSRHAEYWRMRVVLKSKFLPEPGICQAFFSQVAFSRSRF